MQNIFSQNSFTLYSKIRKHTFTFKLLLWKSSLWSIPFLTIHFRLLSQITLYSSSCVMVKLKVPPETDKHISNLLSWYFSWYLKGSSCLRFEIRLIFKVNLEKKPYRVSKWKNVVAISHCKWEISAMTNSIYFIIEHVVS